MARPARIDGSRVPIIEGFALPEAIRRVAAGQMAGQTLYDGAPKWIREMLDRSSQVVFSQADFTALRREDQGRLCEALLAVMSSAWGA